MLFNSVEFIVFLLPVYFVYWLFFSKSTKHQNFLLLITSLFFYAWADWRFFSLLIASVLINYTLGLFIHKNEDDRIKKRYLYLGVIFNLGLLLYFKYANFFFEGFYELLNIFGSSSTYTTLHIIIPLGISFFTFQTLGYLIDVFNEETEPVKDLLTFSVFVTFFPKILSGPIERANSLIPQIVKKRILSYSEVTDGLRQILWGLFAKIVIAENCASIVDPIFEQHETFPGSVLFVGLFFYAIQLYADFSGYSNMAIGVSKLFGIQLTRNFATPYFSVTIGDYWRKWHISLTTWMMDYVFTPLSFILRRRKKMGLIISIITTFILVGFWHGANWTFIVYGILHGLYFIPLVFTNSISQSSIIAKGKLVPNFKDIMKMVLLFILVMLTDTFFRADSVSIAFQYLNNIFSQSILDYPSYILYSGNLLVLALVIFFMFIEWIHREKLHDLEISSYNIYIRWIFYIFIFLLILFFGKSSDTFIYFQF